MILKEAKFVSDNMKPTTPRGRTSANRNVKHTWIKKNMRFFARYFNVFVVVWFPVFGPTISFLKKYTFVFFFIKRDGK